MPPGRKVTTMDTDSRKVFFFTGERKDIPSIGKKREKGKIVASLEEAFRLADVRDGMTISFHHHLRDGDLVVNMALDVLAKMASGTWSSPRRRFFPCTSAFCAMSGQE